MQILVEVDIPKGDYCSEGPSKPEIKCSYLDTCKCFLLPQNNRSLSYEDYTNWRILKHVNCPRTQALLKVCLQGES